MREPNPGSKEAIDLGCACPVMDNHHGHGFDVTQDDGTKTRAFWISAMCKLHGIKDAPKE